MQTDDLVLPSKHDESKRFRVRSRAHVGRAPFRHALRPHPHPLARAGDGLVRHLLDTLHPMVTAITVPTVHVRLNGKSVADKINAAVVANGNAVVTPAVAMHLSPSEVAKQITAATGKAARVLHLDSKSLGTAIDASIALM